MDIHIKYIFDNILLTRNQNKIHFLNELFSKFDFEFRNIILSQMHITSNLLAYYFNCKELYSIFNEIKNVLMNDLYKINICNLISNDYNLTNKIANIFYIYSLNLILNKIIIENKYNNFDKYFQNIISNFPFYNKFIIYNNSISYFVDPYFSNDCYLYMYDKLIFWYMNYNQINMFKPITEPTNYLPIKPVIKPKVIENDSIDDLDDFNIEKFDRELELEYKNNNINKKQQNNEPYKKQYIKKGIKIAVWEKYVGMKTGEIHCPICRRTKITQMDFETGHVLSEVHGGETIISNLRPICTSCNRSMATQNMYEFKQTLKN